MRAHQVFIAIAILAVCASCTPQPAISPARNKQSLRDAIIKLCWGDPADCNVSSPDAGKSDDPNRNPP